MGNPVRSIIPVGRCEVVVVDGSRSGSKFTLNDGIFSMGRGEDNSLPLSEDASASRRHAEIRMENSSYVIHNVSGKNFILVNGKKVEKAELRVGDQIQIGQTHLRIQEIAAVPIVPSLPRVRPVAPTPNQVNVEPLPFAVLQNQNQQTAGYPQSSSAASARSSRPKAGRSGEGSKPFYYIVAVVVLLGIFLATLKNKNTKKNDVIVGSSQIEADIERSEEESKKRREQLEKLKSPEMEATYRSAQEYFTRAMREFYNGQYGRAITAFQVVLNNDPNNAQARYYFDLSRRKFDQQIKDHFKLGLEYREKKSWNKCQSHFSIVMVLLGNQMSDLRYKQAKSYFDECELATGRGY